MITATRRKITSHFQRFEFKYHLSPIQASRILSELVSSHMTFDPTVADIGQKHYTVSSIYFESPDYKCFNENESGEKSRFKVRVRLYGSNPDPNSLVFLEIKRKDDAVVNKDRVAIPYPLYQEVFENAYDPFRLIGHPEVIGEQAVLGEFLAKIARHSMRPTALVRYDRIPLVGRYNERFRVTFDHEIKASPESAFVGHDNFFPVFRNQTVLEVKFNNTLPSWFHQTIERHELRRQKFSKYYNSVRVLKQYNALR